MVASHDASFPVNVQISTVDHADTEHVLAHDCKSIFTAFSNESVRASVHIHYTVLVNPEKLDATWWPVAVCALGFTLILSLRVLQANGRCKPFKPFGETGTKWILSACWSFLYGWADAITYRRYSGFATMMVGNMLLFGQAFVQWTICGDDPRFLLPAPVFFMGVIMLFMVGAALFRCAATRGVTDKWLAPICLVTFMLYDLLAFHIEFDGRKYNRMSIFCLAPVFGAVNAVAVSRGLGTLPWGTTGHVVTTAFVLADLCSCNKEAVDFAAGSKALIMIVSMILGAISGTWFAISESGGIVLEYTIVGCGLALVVYVNDEVFSQEEISSAYEELEFSDMGSGASSAVISNYE